MIRKNYYSQKKSMSIDTKANFFQNMWFEIEGYNAIYAKGETLERHQKRGSVPIHAKIEILSCVTKRPSKFELYQVISRLPFLD